MKNQITTETKKSLIISEDIILKNELFLSNKETIKSLTITNKNILKDILNIYLLELKELQNNENYLNYSKKALLTILSVRIENNLSTEFKHIIKSVFIYLNSKSKLNFNDTLLSTNKFVSGMKFINNKKVDKFNNNKQLFDLIQLDNNDKLIKKANKLNK
jgi:hypothetical protein